MRYCSLHMTSSKTRFAPNFDMACTTLQRVSVPNLNLFGQTKTEYWAREVGEFSIMLYLNMEWWASFCQPTWLLQYKRIEIF